MDSFEEFIGLALRLNRICTGRLTLLLVIRVQLGGSTTRVEAVCDTERRKSVRGIVSVRYS